jgi:hypothetical protein
MKWQQSKATLQSVYSSIGRDRSSGPVHPIVQMCLKLSQADARIALCSAIDPTMSQQEALINPSSLKYSIDVEVGKLHPVGWSQSVSQYGHTKSASVPIELYFSEQLQGRSARPWNAFTPDSAGQDILQFDVANKVDWLASFCHGEQPGVAPHPLMIIWPYVMNVAVVVEKFDVDYARFARSLRPIAAKVTLSCSELRFSYKSSQEMRDNGMRNLDPLITSSKSAATGYNVNLAGKGRRR